MWTPRSGVVKGEPRTSESHQLRAVYDYISHHNPAVNSCLTRPVTLACLGQVLPQSTLGNPGSTLMILRGSHYPTIPKVDPEGQRHDLYSHEYSRVTPTLLNILSFTSFVSFSYTTASTPNKPPSSHAQLQTPITMSFLGGAECSTAGNPLSQFSKIGSDDKSLQRDRLVGRPGGSAQGMRNNQMNGAQDNVRHTHSIQFSLLT